MDTYYQISQKQKQMNFCMYKCFVGLPQIGDNLDKPVMSSVMFGTPYNS